MANIPLKTIKFPKLDNTYTVPEIDSTLTVTGKAADAKKTGDEITAIKADLSQNDAMLRNQDGYFYPIIGRNKWNADGNTNGYYVSNVNGQLVEKNDMLASPYIDISDNTTGYISVYGCTSNNVFYNTAFRGAFYTADYSYISGFDNNLHTSEQSYATLSVPENAKYFRCGISNSSVIKTYMLVFGSTIYNASEYSETLIKIESIREKTVENGNKLNQLYPMLDNASTIENLFDITAKKDGYYLHEDTGVITYTGNANHAVSDYMPVNYNDNLFYAVHNSADTAAVFIANLRYAFYDINKNYISGGITTNTQYEFQELIAPADGFLVIFVGTITADKKPLVSKKSFYKTRDQIYAGYISSGADVVPIPSCWSGKKWISYGDSITAFGNDGAVSWQSYVSKKLNFANSKVCGIGGQTYTYNVKPWFANADGTYNSRDDSGDMTDPTSYTVPDGCTAHYGYLASWDRITTMIPDSVKDTIDLIFVMSVNDGASQTGVIETVPTWIPNATTDALWASAPENTLSGDYDITTLNGAIASTLMKLQTRCPNALIVIGTCWSGRGIGSTKANSYNYDSNGTGIWYEGQTVKFIANYYSFPCIDLWGNSQVNPWNRNTYNTDSIHPSYAGYKKLARAVISGLLSINANL